MRERWWIEPNIKMTSYKNQRKMNRKYYKNHAYRNVCLEKWNEDEDQNRL